MIRGKMRKNEYGDYFCTTDSMLGTCLICERTVMRMLDEAPLFVEIAVWAAKDTHEGRELCGVWRATRVRRCGEEEVRFNDIGERIPISPAQSIILDRVCDQDGGEFWLAMRRAPEVSA